MGWRRSGVGVTPWGQEGLQGVAASACGPPSTSCPAWPHLLCPSVPAPGWRSVHSVDSRGGHGWLQHGLLQGGPSSHLSTPHSATLGPSESHTHSVPPRPGPPSARPTPAVAALGLVWPLGYPWSVASCLHSSSSSCCGQRESPGPPCHNPGSPPGCQHYPSLSRNRSSQRDQSPRPCLPFTSPGPLFLMPTALQPLALYRAPEMSWRAPRRKEPGPGAPVPGRGCWGPGCYGGASGRGCQVGRVAQGCCGCWAFILLNGGAGVGLSLQAPVRCVEEEHEEAAEEDAEAGHQQHGR